MSTLVLDPSPTRALHDLEVDPAEYLTMYNTMLALYKAQLGPASISDKQICQQASEHTFEHLLMAKLAGTQALAPQALGSGGGTTRISTASTGFFPTSDHTNKLPGIFPAAAHKVLYV